MLSGHRMFAALLAGVLAWPTMARAQETIPDPLPVPADLWRASTDARMLITDDASAPEKGGLYTRIGVNWGYKPYLWEWEDGEQVDVVRNTVGTQLSAGWGLGRARLGLTAPIYLYSDGTLQPKGGAALGDASVDLRWSLAESDGNVPGFAVVARGMAPLGGNQKLLGYKGFTWEAGVVVDYELSRWLFAGNLGTRGVPHIERGELTLDDQLWYKAGVACAVTEWGDLSMEVMGSASYTTLFTNTIGNPAEGLVGFAAEVAPGKRVHLAVAHGLNSGIGAPVFRGALAFSMSRVIDRDSDLDGLTDSVDACPEQAEDKDLFQDADGCPEPDNDLDLILDLADACPIDPEDRDKVHDEDGCPEPNARVTVEILDPERRPVPEASTQLVPRVGASITQRSPRFTADLVSGTWLLQVDAPDYRSVVRPFDVPESGEITVQQILEPILVIGTLDLTVTDPEGRPLTATWRLDSQTEEYGATGGHARRDIPPGMHTILVSAEGFASAELPVEIQAKRDTKVEVSLKPSRVELSTERIDIKDTVYFEFNQAVIKPESYSLLDEVAFVIRRHPELLLVRIEGHTDDKGSDTYNLKLSQARADAVRTYLINRGVEPARLVAYGYGEGYPIADNATEEGRAINRRVVFFIERRAD